MLIILISVFIILAIILLILKKNNVAILKLNAKKITIFLLVFLLLLACFQVFVKRHDIIFFFQSLEYKDVDKYDYSNDIVNKGYISKEGAIKIAKEATNKKRIAKVTCELVKNGTYIDYFEATKNLLDKTNKSTNEKQATFWSINLITGWDYACGHEESWHFKIDYNTGKILQCVVTD